MTEYTIKGNHPILKRIDHIATGLDAMKRELEELLNAGYEVTVEQRYLCPDCAKTDCHDPTHLPF